MRKIVLVCAGGFSTSLLVNKMKDAAKEEGYECDIAAYPVADVATVSIGADAVLLGPQVRYKLADAKKACKCPVDAIDMKDYGMMNGKAVLATARKLIGD